MTMQNFTTSRRADVVNVADIASHSRKELLQAIRTVTTYTIADVFSLSPEEIFWTSHHVNDALSMFSNSRLSRLQTPVSYELKTKEYSNKLSRLIENSTQAFSRDTSKSVDLTDWATVIGSIGAECFDERPLVIASYIGKITGILAELGVGHYQSPRPSNYLPNAIMYLRTAQ